MEKLLKNRLSVILFEKKESINGLVKLTGLTQPTLQRQINGDSAVAAKTIMAILNAYPDISAEWLLRGEGSMYKCKESGKTINVYRQGGDGEGQMNVVGEGNDLSDREALMMALKQNQMLIDALLKK